MAEIGLAAANLKTANDKRENLAAPRADRGRRDRVLTLSSCPRSDCNMQTSLVQGSQEQPSRSDTVTEADSFRGPSTEIIVLRRQPTHLPHETTQTQRYWKCDFQQHGAGLARKASRQ